MVSPPQRADTERITPAAKHKEEKGRKGEKNRGAKEKTEKAKKKEKRKGERHDCFASRNAGKRREMKREEELRRKFQIEGGSGSPAFEGLKDGVKTKENPLTLCLSRLYFFFCRKKGAEESAERPNRRRRWRMDITESPRFSAQDTSAKIFSRYVRKGRETKSEEPSSLTHRQ
ncbi:hypothetical protein TGRUB_430090 [Toxoplasma gondii RUB]|uniref:Uncharacterized protein n=1 Tax=Toxoplasma gondii RUB TaxID=935652 RepID=A0A086M3D4_TOXGO|nr:hypothetical protein TGRUB_430090 [Toxoplasma gondii RUB]